MKENDKFIDKFVDTNNRMAIANGLMIAQVICQRKFLDAFDNGPGSTKLVAEIMQDIAKVMERVTEGEELTRIF